MAAEKYGPLKQYVAENTGVRGQLHQGYRDRLVEIAVEEFPTDADDEHGLEVLRARMRLRVKKEYGSIIAILLIGVLVNLISNAVWEWWRKRHSHRVTMTGWRAEYDAKAR